MSKSPDKIEADLWLLISQSSEVVGQWVAHCLNFDIVTQGDSLEHAFEMACDAIRMVVNDDMEADRDPRSRKTAPPEDWAVWERILRTGHRVEGLKHVPVAPGIVVAVPVKMKAERIVEEKPKMIPAWMANQIMNSHPEGAGVNC